MAITTACLPRRTAVAALLLLQWQLPSIIGVRSLSAAPDLSPPAPRRDFLVRCGSSGWAMAAASVARAPPALATEEDANTSLLDAKSIFWDGPPYAAARYGTSTLRASNNEGNTAPSPGEPCLYPTWLGGYRAMKYQFKTASFPQGRRAVSLRVPGAGLGTCLSLPNVGYSPPAAQAVHFLPLKDGTGAYEDWAYNVPRKLEGFWPQAKVLAVQTGGSTNGAGEGALSPKCFVSGDGCTADVNPTLHAPASRMALEFEGPTVRGGRQIQSIDATMLGCCITSNKHSCYVAKSYSQCNALQGLQTFYREVSSLELRSNGDVEGRVRVAAFLPDYIDDVNADKDIARNELEAVAIYDYEIFIKGIDEQEAASL